MKIKIATFNLFNFAESSYYWYKKDDECKYTKTEWNEKIEWIRNQLKIMDADIIGFQEVFSVEALKSLVHASGYQHFAVVDTPKLKDNNIYISSVVAIASKYPISVDSVLVPTIVQEDLHLKPDFSFSRQPIKAKINIQNEEIGILTIFVYICHLKSKLPIIKNFEFDEDTTNWEIKTKEYMQACSQGQIASLIQRGAESTTLYHDGKKKIVALTALMRKILVIANARLRELAINSDMVDDDTVQITSSTVTNN